jgi:CTP:molybdopterin cytidylyltransferase MocA
MSAEHNPAEGFIAVVLAAGLSQRMGRNKLMMEVAGRPMIRHVVETVRGTVERVVVVTGHQGERVREALARLPVTTLDIDPSAGQGATIAAALARLAPERGTLVCVGDQPRLTEREIVGVMEAYFATDGSRVMVPTRLGRRGFPIVVPAGFDAAHIDLAAEDVVSANPDRVAGFETRNPVYESSVDTPQDYRDFFAI